MSRASVRRLAGLLGLAGGMAVAGGALRAELIAQESFDAYGDGAPLHGLAGGVGWLTVATPEATQVGWSVQKASTAAGGYRIVAGPALARAGAVGAAHLAGGWDYLSAGRALDTRREGRGADWADGALIGRPGRPIYIAAWLRSEGAAGGSVFLNAHANRFANQVDRNRVSWGVFGSGAGAGFWGLRGSDGEPVRTDVPAVPGEAALLLVKLEFTVVDAKFAGQASLWVNPRPARAGELLSAAALGAPAVGVETADIRFHSLAVYLGSGPGGGAVDEIRVGTTVEAVLGGR